MPDDLSTRALALVERISRAASAPAGWSDFVAELAGELGDAAIGITLDLPNSPGPTHNYSVNIKIGQTGAFTVSLRKEESAFAITRFAKGMI